MRELSTVNPADVPAVIAALWDDSQPTTIAPEPLTPWGNPSQRHPALWIPFIGAERSDGQLVLLGPDKDLYELLVEEHLQEALTENKSINFREAASPGRE